MPGTGDTPADAAPAPERAAGDRGAGPDAGGESGGDVRVNADTTES
jgi:hypothetical protein